MRFLCDEMLLRLGRWLRAAGYDTIVAEGGAADAALVARAAAEGRVLLTRDRELAREASGTLPALLLAGEDPDETAHHLRRVLAVDWLAAPFTRCLLDNEPLLPAPPGALAGVPMRSRGAAEEALLRCPRCGRLYWPGGHFRRMRERLARWQAAGAPDPP